MAAAASPELRASIQADYLPLLRSHRLAALIGVLSIEIVASAMADIAFVFLVTVTLAASATMLGLLTACWAVGMLAGSALASGVRADRSVFAAFAAAATMGATMLAIGLSPFTGMAGLATVAVMFAAGGTANSVHNASVRTVLQTSAPAGAMGRTAALYVGTTQAATVVGYLLGGMFVPDGAPTAYRLGGIASIAAAAIGWQLFQRRRPLRR